MSTDPSINKTPDPQHIEMLENSTLSGRSARASAQVALEKSLTFWETLRLFWRSTLWVFYGQLVVYGYGIDGAISGYLLAMPQFRQDYGELLGSGPTSMWIIPATWQSLYGGISQLTAIIGAAWTGWLADRIGRRYAVVISCAISLAGVGVQYASTHNGSLGLLTAGKAINGIPIGMWIVLGPLYASEVAPLKLRGWLTAITNIVQFSGVITFTGIIYVLGPKADPLSYKLSFAIQWLVPGLVLLTVWFWPESPVWLARIGKIEAARQSLLRLHGSRSIIDKDAILATIEETIENENNQRKSTEKPTYAECFNARNRHRTLICMFVYGCQYLSGLIFVLGYQSYYYQLVGFTAQKSFLLGMINNCSMFIANILSWPLLTILGRRPLIVWGQCGCAAALFIIGGASLPGTYSACHDIFHITLGTVAWTVVSEIPSLNLRSRTQGLANIVLCVIQWLAGFVFPYMFNPDAGNLGGKVGFVFGATTFIGFLGCWLWLPETKGRTAKELDLLFEGSYDVKHFHKVTLPQNEDADAGKV